MTERTSTGINIKRELNGLNEIVFAVLLLALSYLAGDNLDSGQYLPAFLAISELLGTVFVLEKSRGRSSAAADPLNRDPDNNRGT